jgi:hypothetical protein
MPEGLSDQDRAKIEAASRSASGCMGVVALFFYGFAALVVAIAIFLAATFQGGFDVGILIAAAIAALSVLVGLAFRFIAKQ